ncbi:hypothetical protein [Brachyspira pilosicoli]|uniref:hypothetical protein n=1 Tax=Brachyspira pilosicoli TaxID=52584 RepID=UPI000C780C0C|nr:hypothetical protein [Brachyspira pilosicoli]PLV58549.1 hypothetical protein BPSP16_08655 [Brachyspira pilosicoli SP16]
MSKKLLTIFSLLLIFFAMSCNNKSTDPTVNNNSTDPTAPLKDSQYVGKWYDEKNQNDIKFEIKQDGSIDWFDQTEQPAASASGTNVKKEGDAVFKATFLKNGETNEFVFTFTSDAAGSMTFQGNPPYTYKVVKK